MDLFSDSKLTMLLNCLVTFPIGSVSILDLLTRRVFGR